VKQPALVSDQICTALRQVLKDAREEAGLSLNELSKRAGLNRMAITFIERGDRIPTMETFVMIAAGLGCEPASLLGQAQELAGNTDWKKLGKQLAQAVKARTAV
jgi:transcriptional regulator with XRE-family HTH domain